MTPPHPLVHSDAPAEAVEQASVRAKNIQWSVSGDYSHQPSHLPLEANAQPDFYGNIVEGGISRYYDRAMLDSFTDYLKAQHPQAGAFKALMNIALEQGAWSRLRTAIPTADSFRRQAAKATVSRFSRVAPHDETELLSLAHAQRILGDVPKINPMTTALLNEIEALGTLETADLVDSFHSLLKKHFHFNPSLKSEQAFRAQLEKRRDRPAHSEKFDAQALQDQLNIGSAEFIDRFFIDDEDKVIRLEEKTRFKRLESKSDAQIRAFIEKHYGLSMLSPEAEAELLRKTATGSHQHQHLLVTRREWGDDTSSYRLATMAQAQAENRAYIDHHALTIRRASLRLRDKLLNSIVNEGDAGLILGDHGELIAGRVWRTQQLNSNRVFAYVNRDEPQRLIVDLLLDASASQTDSMTRVTMQAYIIAAALRAARIPVRVSSFQSQQGYTVIQQLIDYDRKDPLETLCSYFPDGANRDGFAFRIVRERMQRRSDSRNVLIVLSDGKPFDERIQINAQADASRKKYSGDFAVEDAARELRVLRRDGIGILGVFTGSADAVEDAQRIYGNSFAYVKRVERFAEIVAHFLRTELHAL